MNALFLFDQAYPQPLLGTDEAGRGPLAGPVVAAAVRLDYLRTADLEGIRDSKQLTPARRQFLSRKIKEQAKSWSVAFVDHEEIDRINIHRASLFAMQKSIGEIRKEREYVLVDGRFPIPEIPLDQQRAVVKGDTQSAAVAAASILAKVARDEWMTELDERFPAYGFKQHKGYATALHIDRLRVFGPCPYHRQTFCRSILETDPILFKKGKGL